MRFYGFGNYYLSSLQQGLQSAHTVAELFIKYDQHSEQTNMVFDWAKDHKTMVLLNGGNSANLAELHSSFEVLEAQGMNLPFAKFHEDEISLNNALTYVGIVVPEKYYTIASEIRQMRNVEVMEFFAFNSLEDWEKELIFILNSYRLAN